MRWKIVIQEKKKKKKKKKKKEEEKLFTKYFLLKKYNLHLFYFCPQGDSNSFLTRSKHNVLTHSAIWSE